MSVQQENNEVKQPLLGEQTGESTGESTGDSNNTTENVQQDGDNNDLFSWVPEEFRGDDGPQWDKFAESYKGLQQKVEEFKAPESYSLNLPEEIPQELLKEDDPVLQKVFTSAKENGLSQKQVDAVVGAFMQDVYGQLEESKKNEVEVLGKDAKEVIGRVETFYQQNLGKEDYELLRSVSTSADVIKVLDKIRAVHMDNKPIPKKLGSVPKQLTEEDLRGIMKSDAYQDSKHPDFAKVRNQVQDGFKALYK